MFLDRHQEDAHWDEVSDEEGTVCPRGPALLGPSGMPGIEASLHLPVQRWVSGRAL